MGMAALIFLAKFLLVFLLVFQPLVAIYLLVTGECSSKKMFLLYLFVPLIAYARASWGAFKSVRYMYRTLD